MKGMYGAMLIGLAIFVAIMGGYLLNAEKVTTCETTWEYVTDISGAFQGDRSDLDVPYNPTANVTGWSAIDDPEGNAGWISGVLFDSVTSTNAYPIFTQTKQFAQLSAIVTADDHDGRSTPGFTIYSSLTEEGAMPNDFGVRNGEAMTLFDAGEYLYYGPFAVPLSAVLDSCYAMDYNAVTVSVTAAGALPCVAVVTKEYAIGPWTDGNHSVVQGVIAKFTAISWATSVKVYPQEGAVSIDGTRYPISDAIVVFGQAQYAGTGAYDDSVRVGMIAEPVVLPSYMDPSKGVQPYQGTYTYSEVQVTDHAGSRSPSLSLAFSNRYGDHTAETVVTGQVDYTSGQQTGTAFSFEFLSGANGVCMLKVTVNGTPTTVNGSSGALTLLMEPQSGGSFTLAIAGDFIGTVTLPDAEISLLTVESTSAGGVGKLDIVATKDNGDALTHTGFGTWDADLSYRSTAGTDTVVPFDKAYWYNGYDNTSVTMLFVAGATETKTAHITLRGTAGAGPSSYWISHTSDGWRVRAVFDADGLTWHDIGKWPAIAIEFGPTSAKVYPVSDFKTFIDYTTINAPTTINSTITDPQRTIRSIVAYSTGDDMRMGVTETITHIAEGGLYLQNGTFVLRSAFPDSEAVSLMIGSTAHLGTSITFIGSGTPVTIPVNPDRTVTIDGENYPLNGITFRWYSSTGSTETIGGQSFAPAVYHRGQSYAADTIWAEVKGGKMVQVMENAGNWAMVLDGVWAPSVFMYDGHNEAAEKTELADWTHGQFRWDSNTFLIVMMGVVVLGGVVGAYLKLCTVADWVVIGMSVAFMWLIL